MMERHLSAIHPLDQAAIRKTQPISVPTAIVVLGLGAVSTGQEYGRFDLTGESYERLRYAVNLARISNFPVLYTGGRLPAGEDNSQSAVASEAAIAQRVAGSEFNYPLKWVETRGVTVRDSAKYTAAILKVQGISKVILIAHAWKSPRAIQEFRAAGLEVVPAPMAFPEGVPMDISAYFPSSEGVRWVRNVVRERLGMLTAKFR